MPTLSRVTRCATRVPPELIDTVIDFHHGDKQVLSTCSLVSRSFLRSCRYHLFSQVAVKLRPNTVLPFLSLSQNSYSTIVPYIKHVVIGDDLSFWKQSRVDALYASLLLLAGTGTVKSLHLNKLNWINMGAWCRTLFLSPGGFSTLTNLEITCVTFGTITELIDCICASPSLRRISLFKVSWRLPVSDPPTRSLQQSSLESLYLCYFDSEPILSWLLSQEALPALKSLTLFHVRSRSTRSVGPFLERLCSLEHLELDASFFRTENLNVNHVTTDLSRQVDLSHNTALHSIQFADLHPPTDCSWAPFLLSKVKSPYLFCVEFIIALRTLPDLDTINWPLLTEIFTRPGLDCIKRVEYRVTGSVDADEVVRGINERLALYDKRGILSVVYGGVFEPHPRERRDGLMW